MCLSGRTNICRHITFPSFPPRNGALAEYIACPAHAVYPIPDSATFTEGALLEPLGVAIHAVRLEQLSPEHAVADLGARAIVVCTVLTLKQMAVEGLAVVEPVAGRREWVQERGVERVAADAQELLDTGYEADIVFECAGENAAIEDALHLAKPAGKVIVVGIPHPERISLEANIPRRKELTLIFSRRSRDTLAEAVRMLATGRIDLASIPVRPFTLDQTAEAIEATASRPGDMLRAAVIP